MLPILALLLFLPPSSAMTIQPFTGGCRTGQAAECQKASFVPGHSLLGQGVNIVTMKRTNTYLIDMQNYLKANKTCTLCRNLHTREFEKLPTSMVNWIPLTRLKASIISKTEESVVSLSRDESSSVQNDWSADLDIKYKTASFNTVWAGSESEITKFAESKSLTNKYKFIRQQVESSLYSFQLSKAYTLYPHFLSEAKDLPNTYNSSTQGQFDAFIEEFGTHYISKTVAGGKGVEVIAVKVCEVEMKGMDMEEVKSCLTAESKASVEGKISANLQTKLKKCRESAKKFNYGSNYHKSFDERISEVRGGSASFDLFKEGNAERMNNWLNTVKTQPDTLKYSLKPIHTLLYFRSGKKASLRRALQEYIKTRALKKNCKCSGRSRRKVGECSCMCTPSGLETSDCCPKQPGTANIKVTIQRAKNLYGDVLTQTDAFVKFTIGELTLQTRIVPNNDNPVWNQVLDFGLQDLSEGKKYKIEVWDEDKFLFFKRYQKLGMCERPLISGNMPYECQLKHGIVMYTVRTTCSSHLQGNYCEKYHPG